MIRNFFIVTVLISLSLIGARWFLEDHRLLSLASELQGGLYTPAVGYYAGELYYSCRAYATAETYFKYVISLYPESPYMERASLLRLQCLRYGLLRPPAQTIAECQTFLKEHPDSLYAPSVRKLAENYERSVYNKMEAAPSYRADGFRDLKDN